MMNELELAKFEAYEELTLAIRMVKERADAFDPDAGDDHIGEDGGMASAYLPPLLAACKILGRCKELHMKANDEYHESFEMGEHCKPEFAAKLLFKRRQAAAHIAVRLAKEAGKLIQPGECEDCERAYATLLAHHDDYSKQLDVRWLCRSCHTKWHSKHGSAK